MNLTIPKDSEVWETWCVSGTRNPSIISTAQSMRDIPVLLTVGDWSECGQVVQFDDQSEVIVAAIYLAVGRVTAWIQYDWESDEWSVAFETSKDVTFRKHKSKEGAFGDFCRELMLLNPLNFASLTSDEPIPVSETYTERGYGSWA